MITRIPSVAAAARLWPISRHRSPAPSAAPSRAPSGGPTKTPSLAPTADPTSATPTTSTPTTSTPTADPTTSNPTTANPTASPTANPTANPTTNPTPNPTANPAPYPTPPPTLQTKYCGGSMGSPRRGHYGGMSRGTGCTWVGPSVASDSCDCCANGQEFEWVTTCSGSRKCS